MMISGPNENSPKASISVYVLAANSKDGVFVRTRRPRAENSKNALVLDDEMDDPWNRRDKSNTLSGQTLQGSFSAVSKPKFASKY